MASEWAALPLGDLCLRITDGAHSSPPSVQFGKRMVSVKDLTRFGVELKDARHISESDFELLVKQGCQPQVGDVLIAKDGNSALDTTCVVKKPLDAVLLSSVAILRPNPEKLVPEFLKQHLSSQNTIEYLKAEFISGAAIPRVILKDFRRAVINVPPLNEQRAIAHILGTLDDRIELNLRANETLEAMVRALFKTWFVDFEPVRAKVEGRWQRGQSLPGLPAHYYDLFPDRLVESELGEIPEGWQTVPVYDIATYVNGAAFKAFQPNDQGRGLPIIKIAELKAGVTARTKFSEVAMPEKYRLRTGDVLFSWSGNPDTSIDTFIWAHGDAWLNQHIFRVDVHDPNERAFVIATLKYLRPVFAEIARNKQTTGLGHVTVGEMQRLLVVKPEEQALAAWDRIAAPIFAAAFRNEADSISLDRLRDTLLPKLISGELRVADAERLLGNVEMA